MRVAAEPARQAAAAAKGGKACARAAQSASRPTRALCPLPLPVPAPALLPSCPTCSRSRALSVCPAWKYPSSRTTGGLGASGAAATCHFIVWSGMPARCLSTCFEGSQGGSAEASVSAGQRLVPAGAAQGQGRAGRCVSCGRRLTARLQLVAGHGLGPREVLLDQYHDGILRRYRIHTRIGVAGCMMARHPTSPHWGAQPGLAERPCKQEQAWATAAAAAAPPAPGRACR